MGWTPTSATRRWGRRLLALARRMGYPAVLKPKSHLAVGMARRGAIVGDETELRANFVPHSIPTTASALAQRYPDDPLVRLHHQRLSRGENGDLVVLESK